MRKLLLLTALCVAAPLSLATAATAEQTLAQQTVTFLCAAPTGHVCQFAVQTGGSQINFALPSGERKEAPGVTPHADKYCVCDPGPVTLTARRPSWIIGAWAPGLTSMPDSIPRTTTASRFSPQRGATPNGPLERDDSRARVLEAMWAEQAVLLK